MIKEKKGYKMLKATKVVLGTWKLESMEVSNKNGLTMWYKMPFSPYMTNLENHAATITFLNGSYAIAIYRPTGLQYPVLMEMMFLSTLEESFMFAHNVLVHLAYDCTCPTEVSAGISSRSPCKSCQAYLDSKAQKEVF